MRLGRTILAALFAASAFAAGALPAVAAGTRLAYTVVRQGSEIGTHVVEIERQGDAASVTISTNVVVKLGFIPVYRFEQSSTESWKANRLVSLRSKTNDDGTMHDLTVDKVGNQLRINADGHSGIADQALLPASLWFPGMVSQTILLNTVKGSQMRVTAQDLGQENVPTARGEVSARHYKVAGELERDLWFDRAGTLVRVQMKGSDGSLVVYVMR